MSHIAKSQVAEGTRTADLGKSQETYATLRCTCWFRNDWALQVLHGACRACRACGTVRPLKCKTAQRAAETQNLSKSGWCRMTGRKADTFHCCAKAWLKMLLANLKPNLKPNPDIEVSVRVKCEVASHVTCIDNFESCLTSLDAINWWTNRGIQPECRLLARFLANP